MENTSHTGIWIIVILSTLAVLGFFSYATMANEHLAIQTSLADSPSVAEASSKEVTVLYTEEGFVPKDIELARGDTVYFINRTSEPFRPASLKQKIPNAQIFDPGQDIKPGGIYIISFITKGSTKFGDANKTSMTGTVIVR